ncbi:unnamed protein product [Phytophthora fragariaefolia]|uniref:Unnamed protein product n=1 Tax=Phytophthora fragariaefolia TaxID=1490495 RepID=A0A9W6YAY7_9STRA|nr:unnamed protein product [Phytophthora fragariaefolia]
MPRFRQAQHSISDSTNHSAETEDIAENAAAVRSLPASVLSSCSFLILPSSSTMKTAPRRQREFQKRVRLTNEQDLQICMRHREFPTDPTDTYDELRE